VYPLKPQKIDLNSEYPCPCRRRGRLVPIALTEALGCNRCQQIFVVGENGYAIEDVSAAYPYKQTLHWTGHQWSRVNHRFSYRRPMFMALFVIAALLTGLVLVYLTKHKDEPTIPNLPPSQQGSSRQGLGRAAIG